MISSLQSLHNHTLLSDGLLTYQQSLNSAQKYGIGVVAFTEHDFLPDSKQINQLKKLETKIKWLIGIELSAGQPRELGGGPNGPHMIGLFIDPTNKRLLGHCQKSLEQRMIRMQKMVKSFVSLGFDISVKDVLKVAKGRSVGQPHIVGALRSKAKNLKLVDEYLVKLKKDAENNPKLAKLYKNMHQQGQGQYVYGLFLRDDGYLSKQVRADYEYWLDFDQSVELIRSAGGISIFAHYAMHKINFPLKIVEKILKENRVDGAEIVYGLWTKGTDEEEETEKDRNNIKNWVKKYDKIASGGADAHKEEDYKNFSEDKKYSKETTGMLEDILVKKKVDITWSNLD